jgi:hypothetical protein
VLNQQNQFSAYFERYIIVEIQKQYIFQGVNGNCYIRGQGNTLQRAVQLTQQIWVAEKRSENTVFVVFIHRHFVLRLYMARICCFALLKRENPEGFSPCCFMFV